MSQRWFGCHNHTAIVFVNDTHSIAVQVVLDDLQLPLDDFRVVVGSPVSTHLSANVVVNAFRLHRLLDAGWRHPELVDEQPLQRSTNWTALVVETAMRDSDAAPVDVGAGIKADPLAFGLTMQVNSEVGVDEQ